MSVEVNGIRYFSKAEVAEIISVSRQTLYRWIDEGKIPAPRHERRRDGRLLYSQADLDEIQSFANDVEPVDQSSPDQMRLFSNEGRS